MRLQLADNENDQSIHDRVFTAMRYLLRQRVELRRPVTYIDATNLTPRDRKPFLDLAHELGAVTGAIWFDIPLEVCKARNAARHRVVPPEALDQLAAKLVPPSLDEGFATIEAMALNPDAKSEGLVSRLITR